MRQLLIVRFSGELTPSSLSRATDDITSRFERGIVADLVVDCSALTSYTAAAKDSFVSWLGRHSGHLRYVAVVTPKPLWQMIVRAMSLGFRFKIKPFARLEQAEDWIESEHEGIEA